MLSKEQINSFHRDGYLAVENLVDVGTVLEPVKVEYTDRLRTLCRRWVDDKPVLAK